MAAPSAGFPAGLYGKLPQRGDFVTRRLPGVFADRWDAWLQASLASSRETLGSDWLALYLSAPLWRFVVQAGVLIDCGVAGVLMPSVDAVNRHFPLTVAAGVAPGQGAFALAVEADAWFVAAEALALSFLDSEVALPDLLVALDALPPLVPGAVLAAAACVPQGSAAVLAGRLGAPLPESLAALYPHLLDALAPAAGGLGSLWWTAGSDAVEPRLIAYSGMPPASAFAGFLTDRPPEDATGCDAAGDGLWRSA